MQVTGYSFILTNIDPSSILSDYKVNELLVNKPIRLHNNDLFDKNRNRKFLIPERRSLLHIDSGRTMKNTNVGLRIVGKSSWKIVSNINFLSNFTHAQP